MTVLTDFVATKPATISLPSELVEAGKLPGTTFPAARVGVQKPAAVVRQPDSDFLVDLSKMSVLSAGFRTSVPPVECLELGRVHRAALETLGQVSLGDLVPQFATVSGGRARGTS